MISILKWTRSVNDNWQAGRKTIRMKSEWKCETGQLESVLRIRLDSLNRRIERSSDGYWLSFMLAIRMLVIALERMASLGFPVWEGPYGSVRYMCFHTENGKESTKDAGPSELLACWEILTNMKEESARVFCVGKLWAMLVWLGVMANNHNHENIRFRMLLSLLKVGWWETLSSNLFGPLFRRRVWLSQALDSSRCPWCGTHGVSCKLR